MTTSEGVFRPELVQDPTTEWASGRSYALIVLAAAQSAGLTPMPSWQVHRLTFLADCLAPLFDLPVLTGRVLKNQRGPFYRELQWHLDRLAMQGLVDMSNIAHRRFGGGWWFFADYAVNALGMSILAEVIKASPRLSDALGFMREISSAYEQLGTRARRRAALRDVNFQDPEVRDADIIDFTEARRNLSVRTANAFQDLITTQVPLTRRERLHLYFRYLDHAVEEAV